MSRVQANVDGGQCIKKMGVGCGSVENSYRPVARGYLF